MYDYLGFVLSTASVGEQDGCLHTYIAEIVRDCGKSDFLMLLCTCCNAFTGVLQ